jgi:methyl-accepting chemotaxis protein
MLNDKLGSLKTSSQGNMATLSLLRLIRKNRYLTTSTDSEYQALQMVLTFLHTKLSQSTMMDDRVQSYITKFQTFIEHDFALEQKIHVINNEFDEISRELMALLLESSHTMETLSQEVIVTGEELRGRIQQQFFISGVIAFIGLLFIISFIARTIITPIRQMSNVVMQVKTGNDQARFTSHEKDDIAELGFAFNDMLETIRQHRYRLEALVEERTEHSNTPTLQHSSPLKLRTLALG